ncbi:MAG: efflux RND transporter periplasmic adaptor subunit [Pseudoxanthomonas sp.]
MLSPCLRLAVTAGILVLAACSKSETPEPVPSLTVSVATPQRDTIVRDVVASGAVAAWEEVSVGVELSGLRVAGVDVEVGSVVKRGDVLLRLDARTQDARLAETEAAVAEARANLEVAERKQRRLDELAAQKLVSQQEADEARAARSSARARLDTAVASRDSMKVQRDFTVVRAPVDGVVSARSVQPGQVVSAGTELLRLIRDGRLEWRAELAEADLLQVAEGGEVFVRSPAGGEVAGRIRRVSPALDVQRRIGTIYADLPKPGALRAGMFAQGRIVLGQASALLVPQDSVVRRDGRAYVFVVGGDSRAQERSVETGGSFDGRIEVRSGLKGDERVVSRGAGFLGDGDLVRVVDGTAAAATKDAGR